MGTFKASAIIQPHLTTSTDGSHSITIQPMDSLGVTGSVATLNKGSQTLWSKRRKHSAVMADVGNSGHTATCAHSLGLEPAFDRNYPNHKGQTVLAVYQANGQPLWSKTFERKESLQFHQPPTPHCDQVLIQNHSQLAWFWLSGHPVITVDLKSGTEQTPVQWPDHNLEGITSPVKTTHHDLDHSDWLLLETHGRVYEENKSGNGYYGYLADAVFHLVNASGEVQWSKQLLGSLDIRNDEYANNIQKAFLQDHDLVQVHDRGFVILDYQGRQKHGFQLDKDQSVRPTKTTPFTPPNPGPNINHLPRQTNTPSQVIELAKSGAPCDQHFSDIDTLSDGSLVLYQETNRMVLIFSPPYDQPPQKVELPAHVFEDNLITDELMFADANDRIHINLGSGSFAVIQPNGQWQLTSLKANFCDPHCELNVVAQKNQPNRYWQESLPHGIHRFNLQDTNHEKLSTTQKDSQGEWLEYIYSMQTDQSGRLLALGRTGNTRNWLYLFDQSGRPISRKDLGVGYVDAITLADKHIIYSPQKSAEIITLDEQGTPRQRTQIGSGDVPYLLQANGEHNRLFAVTKDHILVFALSGFSGPTAQTKSP